MCNNPKPPMTTFSRLIILCSFCMLPSVIQAIQKDSISIAQYVRDSFTRYGVKNALVTVMDSRRTRQTLWSAVQMLTQKLCCQTIHDCPKVVPLHYESE